MVKMIWIPKCPHFSKICLVFWSHRYGFVIFCSSCGLTFVVSLLWPCSVALYSCGLTLLVSLSHPCGFMVFITIGHTHIFSRMESFLYGKQQVPFCMTSSLHTAILFSSCQGVGYFYTARILLSFAILLLLFVGAPTIIHCAHFTLLIFISKLCLFNLKLK